MTNVRRPQVFLSFAGNDRPMAERLRADLEPHGIDAFVDTRDIPPGRNVVLLINEKLETSDYYVLLWSRNCVRRPWVEEEWAAAYSREVAGLRSFLFIVRLDETPLPPVLAARRYLDGFRGWAATVLRLVDSWHDDLAAGTPVYPPPSLPDSPPALAVLVRNQAFTMTHVVGVPPQRMKDALLDIVRDTLALPDTESQLGGRLEIHLSYRLLHNGDLVPDKPVADLDLADGTLVDLEVHVLAQGPDGPFGERTYRAAADVPPAAPENSIDALVRRAFAHLLSG